MIGLSEGQLRDGLIVQLCAGCGDIPSQIETVIGADVKAELLVDAGGRRGVRPVVEAAKRRGRGGLVREGEAYRIGRGVCVEERLKASARGPPSRDPADGASRVAV